MAAIVVRAARAGVLKKSRTAAQLPHKRELAETSATVIDRDHCARIELRPADSKHWQQERGQILALQAFDPHSCTAGNPASFKCSTAERGSPWSSRSFKASLRAR